MKLKLLENDYQQIYVWVLEHDHSQVMSPHFDYREDAIAWYEKNKTNWDHYSDLPAPNFYK